MIDKRLPLIANRFELLLIVLLCFVISTRLIWLYIDDPVIAVTNDFYLTSLAFNHSLAGLCMTPLGYDFPYSMGPIKGGVISSAATSPGLSLVFLGICQFERLDVGSFTALTPHLIALSALLVALILRLLTTSWVAGILAASVVLSRGSVLQATNLAGSFSLLQPTICLLFLLLAAYCRTSDQRWIWGAHVSLLLATLITPILFIATVPTAIALLAYDYRRYRIQKLTSAAPKEVSKALFTLAPALLYPLLLWALVVFAPSSLRTLFELPATFMSAGKGSLAFTITAVSDRLGVTDLHFVASFSLLVLAYFLIPRLTSKPRLFFNVLFLMLGLGLVIDGLLAERYLNSAIEIQTVALTLLGFEPLVLGLGAGLLWGYIRTFLATVFPNYGRPRNVHGTMGLAEMR